MLLGLRLQNHPLCRNILALVPTKLCMVPLVPSGAFLAAPAQSLPSLLLELDWSFNLRISFQHQIPILVVLLSLVLAGEVVHSLEVVVLGRKNTRETKIISRSSSHNFMLLGGPCSMIGLARPPATHASTTNTSTVAELQHQLAQLEQQIQRQTPK